MEDEQALRALRDQLADGLPEGLAALHPRELADLATAVREARERQSAALDAAVHETMGHVPWLMRGPVRRILFG
jgi:hypothetical protein